MITFRMRQHLVWGASACVLVAVLSLAAANAPAGLKKIGLFSIAFGILVGWCLSPLGRRFDLAGRLIVTIATAMLIIAGLVNVAIQSHRQLREERRAARPDDPQQQLALQLLDTATVDGSPTTALLRRQYDPAFSDYLANRFSALGEWTLTWAWPLWILEIALAAAAGTWVARHMLGAPSASPPQEVTSSGGARGVHEDTETEQT